MQLLARFFMLSCTDLVDVPAKISYHGSEICRFTEPMNAE